jgi:hypothetical protein
MPLSLIGITPTIAQIGRDCARLSTRLRVVGGLAAQVTVQGESGRRTVYLCIGACRGEHPHLPHRARAWSAEILLPRPRCSPAASTGTSPSTTSRSFAPRRSRRKRITLSDGDNQEERAPTRRSARQPRSGCWSPSGVPEREFCAGQRQGCAAAAAAGQASAPVRVLRDLDRRQEGRPPNVQIGDHCPERPRATWNQPARRGMDHVQLRPLSMVA